ncbi:MAG TPA: RHS repeat-associated core domain-containing protein [Anaerolineales bacterium]|nr:RHS repeat-associated core domain-containing protein [Anaerolineales bacterium]
MQRLDGTKTYTITTDILSLPGGPVSQSETLPRKLAGYSNGGASYYQLDALGSGRAVTGAGGAVAGGFTDYGDFGTRLSPAPTPLAPSFTGYEHDAYSGLEYAKNRYYDPATASFISSDPYPVDHSDLLGANLYNYVQGNPVNSTDPLGWFVITGFSTSRIYFKTEQNETRSSISKEFDTNWRSIIITTGRKGTNNPRYSEKTSIDVNSPGYGPMCPATIGTSSICQTNMLNKITKLSGQKIFNYTKSGLVPVDDLKVILQPQPTPTPTPTVTIFFGGSNEDISMEGPEPQKQTPVWYEIANLSVRYPGGTAKEGKGKVGQANSIDKVQYENSNLIVIGYSAGADTALYFSNEYRKHIENNQKSGFISDLVLLGPTLTWTNTDGNQMLGDRSVIDPILNTLLTWGTDIYILDDLTGDPKDVTNILGDPASPDANTYLPPSSAKGTYTFLYKDIPHWDGGKPGQYGIGTNNSVTFRDEVLAWIRNY